MNVDLDDGDVEGTGSAEGGQHHRLVLLVCVRACVRWRFGI